MSVTMSGTWMILLLLFVHVKCENVPATKVFVIPIEPSLFNWTQKIGDEFSYRASLLNAPDLPKWMEYLYSHRHRTGFLYGVPPQDEKELQIEIIGLKSRTYETRRRVIHLNIENKQDAATREVYLKIDNLNVEDFFDPYRMTQLLNIFKYKLWKESFFDLYFTFLTSAVSLGARRPLRPTEGEGVVIRLGSVSEFSNTLIELQDEVKPLWKLQTCPRDFKRTTVERIFRDEGFILDWCNFKLIRPSPGPVKSTDDAELLPEPEILKEPLWSKPNKAEVARRSYTNEFILTILVPTFIMVVLLILLSIILGIQREGSSARKSAAVDGSQHRFQSSSRPTSTLCTFSDANGTTRSRTSSPPASSIVTNGLTRPRPPPYSGTMLTTVVDF